MKTEIINKYKQYCKLNNIPFSIEPSVISPDDTTLFTTSGMQQFKSKFKDKNYHNTISNIQPCIRLNDIDEIGDGQHLLYFNMIGLFSFREKSLKEMVDFWMGFLKSINIIPDYVTIHPDKKEWMSLYDGYNIEVRLDSECIWSDGEISGYCTEFYKNGIEIGNIVNPLGDSIDCGFGLERLEIILTSISKSKEETLKETIFKLIEFGISPSNTKQGYILRKLLRLCYSEKIQIDHEFYNDEIKRQDKIIQKYNKLKDRHKDKSKEWWMDTMGVDLDLI